MDSVVASFRQAIVDVEAEASIEAVEAKEAELARSLALDLGREELA